MRRLRSHRCSSIDISLGGRLLPRFSTRWQCELYLLDVEVQMRVPHGNRMNVAHSVDPDVLSAAARETLTSSFQLSEGRCDWLPVADPPE